MSSSVVRDVQCVDKQQNKADPKKKYFPVRLIGTLNNLSKKYIVLISFKEIS
jgi:hypothetical protein